MRVFSHRPGLTCVEVSEEKNRMVIRNLSSQSVEKSVTFTPSGAIVISDRAHPHEPGAKNLVMKAYSLMEPEEGVLPALTAAESYERAHSKAAEEGCEIVVMGAAQQSIISRVVPGPEQSWFVLVVDCFSWHTVFSIWKIGMDDIEYIHFADLKGHGVYIGDKAAIEFSQPSEWGAFEDGALRDWRTGELLGRVAHMTHPVTAHIPSDRFAIRTKRFRMAIRGRDGEHIHTTRPADSEPTAASFSPDGTLIYVGTKTGQIHQFDSYTGENLGHREVHHIAVNTLAVHDNGQDVYSGDKDGLVKHTNFADDSASALRHQHTNPIWGIALTTKGYSWSQWGPLRQWSLR
jgi:hypothetical protein